MDEEVTTNIEVGFVKTDPELIKKLFARLKSKKGKRAYTDEKQIKTLMRYNVWDVNQFSDVSGLDISTINNLTRPQVVEDRIVFKLNSCFPFPSSRGRGSKFIVRNEKSEMYIKV